MLKGVFLTLNHLSLNCLAFTSSPTSFFLWFLKELSYGAQGDLPSEIFLCLLSAGILTMCQSEPPGLLFKTDQHLVVTIGFLFLFSSSHVPFQHVSSLELAKSICFFQDVAVSDATKEPSEHDLGRWAGQQFGHKHFSSTVPSIDVTWWQIGSRCWGKAAAYAIVISG